MAMFTNKVKDLTILPLKLIHDDLKFNTYTKTQIVSLH